VPAADDWRDNFQTRDKKRISSMAKNDFYHGIIAALAVVEIHQQDVLFDEIVRTVNESELLHAARRDGSMKWSGLYRYMKRVKEMRDERGV